MKSLKSYFTPILALFSVIIGFLVFLVTRKNKEIDDLEAEVDLSEQTTKSKQVDKEVSLAQKEIDTLSQEMKKPAEESDKFWDDYSKGKK